MMGLLVSRMARSRAEMFRISISLPASYLKHDSLSDSNCLRNDSIMFASLRAVTLEFGFLCRLAIDENLDRSCNNRKSVVSRPEERSSPFAGLAGLGVFAGRPLTQTSGALLGLRRRKADRLMTQISAPGHELAYLRSAPRAIRSS